MISVIIDIAIALIALIIIIRHVRIGFIKSIFGTLKPIIAGVLAFIFRVPVAKLFLPLFNNSVNGWVLDSLTATAGGADQSFDLVSLYNSCPIVYTKGLKSFGLNLENGFHESMTNIETIDEGARVALAENIGYSISWLAAIICAIVSIFIVAIIFISIVTSLLNALTHFSVLKVINRILGGIVGLFWAVAFAFAIGLMLGFVATIIPNIVGENVISDSIILGFMADLDLLSIIPGL